MSKYTILVKNICESLAGETDTLNSTNVEEIIKKSYNKIFDNFPLYDNAHREELCIKILRHYYMREIGFETYPLWRFYINANLNEIMPKYNELYKTVDMKYEPLLNKQIERELKQNSKGSNEGTNKSVSKFLDTPQNGISDLENNKYLTNAGIDDSNGNTKYEDENNIKEIIKGKDGTISYAELIKEYRDNIINVDLMIIDELSDNFLNIW